MALSLPDLFWNGFAAGVGATIAAGALVLYGVLAFFSRLDRQVEEPPR